MFDDGMRLSSHGSMRMTVGTQQVAVLSDRVLPGATYTSNDGGGGALGTGGPDAHGARLLPDIDLGSMREICASCPRRTRCSPCTASTSV